MSGRVPQDSLDPPWDLSAAMRALCNDCCFRLNELSHIDMNQVGLSFISARNPSPYGTVASLTPLKFAEGRDQEERNGVTHRIQNIYGTRGQTLLYILSFYLPRFFERSLEDKLTTVMHELWHISPKFNGDVRRFQGRNYVHGNSAKEFDAHAARLARDWLLKDPPATLYDFLELRFAELQQQYGRILVTRHRAPKILPVIS